MTVKGEVRGLPGLGDTTRSRAVNKHKQRASSSLFSTLVIVPRPPFHILSRNDIFRWKPSPKTTRLGLPDVSRTSYESEREQKSALLTTKPCAIHVFRKSYPTSFTQRSVIFSVITRRKPTDEHQLTPYKTLKTNFTSNRELKLSTFIS